MWAHMIFSVSGEGSVLEMNICMFGEGSLVK
ncbi:rCG39160 [Rattus norvegicus]|uniref:RCG39160 n=1 Tax=Rattus norvegicus TaxID=10116 RepID=A6JXX7_RAT|nr:rCG39160 [Rattus norvegicus]